MLIAAAICLLIGIAAAVSAIRSIDHLENVSAARLVTLGIVTGLGLFAGAALLGISALQNAQREFITECVDHRPRYECVYLWRTSRSADSGPIIVPVPTLR